MQFNGVKNFKITLLHPSRGRSQKAKQTLDFWVSASSGENQIEHILSLDEDDPQRKGYVSLFEDSEKTKAVLINPNTCVVEATNHAAQLATGDILIYLSDDFHCPRDWDKSVIESVTTLDTPLLIKVDDCLQPFTADVLTIPIMNRVLYNRLGYFWNPLYRSQFVDQDLYWVCYNNGWMKMRQDLRFPHEHYVKGAAPNDDTYKRNAANWNQGKEVYRQRKNEGFPI